MHEYSNRVKSMEAGNNQVHQSMTCNKSVERVRWGVVFECKPEVTARHRMPKRLKGGQLVYAFVTVVCREDCRTCGWEITLRVNQRLRCIYADMYTAV